MWWFSSCDPSHPEHGGRFDLPAPEGACYLATTPATATLEALQEDFAGGLLPASALHVRSMSTVTLPNGLPAAANLTSARSAGTGVTVGLWADSDRALTQLWAAELHGAGWQALYHGAQYEPTGQGRSVTLFDRAGAHGPWGAQWAQPETSSLSSDETVRVLAAHGITVSALAAPDFEMTGTL